MKTQLSATRVPRRTIRLLAFLCVLMLAASTLPLYAIAFQNHPYYDDFGFSRSVHDVWAATHSIGQVLRTAWASAQTVRATWQGTYTGTLLSNLQPGVFSESLYWVTTFLLLTAFLLCFGFFFHTVFRKLFGAARAEAVCISSLLLFLMTQFLPAVNESFYWFNGGIGNTFIYSLLALAIALLIRLSTAKRGAPWLIAALLPLVTLLGGGSYGGGLFGILLFMLASVFMFIKRNRYRYVYAGLTVWFLLCFMYSISAPGNDVRAAIISAHPSAVKSVLQALYYGVALMGNYATLPVLAVGLMLSPLLLRVAKESRFHFEHPVWVLLAGVCLFCAQLTPPLYSGVFLGGGRIADTYYFSFITLFFLYETYLLGFLARRRARLGKPSLFSGAHVRHSLALAGICLFLLGCAGYKPNGETLYGPMNMAGGSAALSIVTGEAAQYDREMTAREALLNDASQPVVTLAPLTTVPDVFMDDLLSPDAVYDVTPVLCAYYHKDAILIQGGAAQ
ncbi:MAG: hypothetical protein PHY64_03680 [Eubacteriales bacterium]|nr:hypothetical protein [Eubacteriales bacterium]